MDVRAAAYGYLGYALALAGRTEIAIAHLEQAIRMSPHDPQNAIFNMGIAVAHFLASRYAEAISFARKAIYRRYSFATAAPTQDFRHAYATMEQTIPAMQAMQLLASGGVTSTSTGTSRRKGGHN